MDGNQCNTYCVYCRICYPTEQFLKQHLDTWRPCCIKYHGNNPSAIGYSPELEYSCDRCKIKFASLQALNEHRNNHVWCGQQSLFAQLTACASAASSLEATSLADSVHLDPKIRATSNNSQAQEIRELMSPVQAIERAIQCSVAHHRPGRYIPPVCHFCRESYPEFWRSDVHEICTACREGFLAIHRFRYVQDNKALRRDPVMQSSDASQTKDALQTSTPPQFAPEFIIAPQSAPPPGYTPSYLSKIEPCNECCDSHSQCWTRAIQQPCYGCAVLSKNCTRVRPDA